MRTLATTITRSSGPCTNWAGSSGCPRVAPPRSIEEVGQRYTTAPPTVRRLRAFAFDPSLATRLDTAVVNAVTIPVPFEPQLRPGPVGDYLAVIDVDPATGCAYVPVDL